MLNHLQRTACLAITGALESLLFLPTLDSFIQTEAKITVFRLKSLITEVHLNRRNSHCDILFGLFESSAILHSDERW